LVFYLILIILRIHGTTNLKFIKRGVKASAPPDAKICVSNRGDFLEKFERTLCMAGRWK
jgi:hypothetical protein